MSRLSRFDPMRRARMRSLRTYLLVAGAVLAASCGGAGPIGSAPTPDPLAGQYIVNGGVGATPGKIRVLIRESGASTRSAFEAYFFDGKKLPYATNAVEVTTISETVKAINSFKESIGMVTMNASTFSDNTIAFTMIDGVAASRENLNSGKYQVRRPLYFVYNSDPTKLKPAIKAFLDFVKGPEGQKILAGL